ncbi:hypothetical protein [Lignipirellula cremea]|nr:hypothetical protein [Lignipirellula cremea]
MADLLTNTFHADFGNLNRDDTPPLEKQYGPITFRMSTSVPKVPVFESPVVQAVDVSSDGKFLVCGSRNALTWITNGGAVAHGLLIDDGSSVGPEFDRTIISIALSYTADLLVAEMSKVGLFVIQSGKTIAKLDLSTENKILWAFDRENGLIAVKRLAEPHISIYDRRFDQVGLVSPKKDLKDFFFSPSGRYLFCKDARCSVFEVVQDC